MNKMAVALVCVVVSVSAVAKEPLRRIEAPEARQGVAVDENFVYGIGNQVVSKRDKFTGEQLAIWEADDERPLIHLNSGVVIGDKLICAHSNHSDLPMTSSIEIWDTETLEHIESHSLGILYGSLTWCEPRGDYWFACFAHYDRKGGYPHKDHTYTSLVKFDNEWRRVASWVFPKEVTDRFHPYSSSGGSWGPDDFLYCTGHDHSELYVMALPKAGSILRLVDTKPFPVEGQAIAFDRSGTGLLYGIVRDEGVIIAEPAPLTDKKVE